MIIASGLSVYFTHVTLREENAFTYHPIIEVAILFAGIFVTMVPVLKLLEVNGSRLGITEPWQFFWASGSLSSFLDNAPTYMVFFTAAQSVATAKGIVGNLIMGVPEIYLRAISVGAVFMGANSYIGNGPNFMVKAICEENEINMPSFFGYMAWSMAILVPLFILITFILQLKGLTSPPPAAKPRSHPLSLKNELVGLTPLACGWAHVAPSSSKAAGATPSRSRMSWLGSRLSSLDGGRPLCPAGCSRFRSWNKIVKSDIEYRYCIKEVFDFNVIRIHDSTIRRYFKRGHLRLLYGCFFSSIVLRPSPAMLSGTVVHRFFYYSLSTIHDSLFTVLTLFVSLSKKPCR